MRHILPTRCMRSGPCELNFRLGHSLPEAKINLAQTGLHMQGRPPVRHCLHQDGGSLAAAVKIRADDRAKRALHRWHELPRQKTYLLPARIT